MDRTVPFKQELSGHELQTGLDTKTDRLTVSCDVTLILTLNYSVMQAPLKFRNERVLKRCDWIFETISIKKHDYM
jgi:hypothetical protein